MKQVVIFSAVLIFALFSLPLIAVRGESLKSVYQNSEPMLTPKASVNSSVAVSTSEQSKSSSNTLTSVIDPTINVKVQKNGSVQTMTMDKYLMGVVAAEMPASFELEALKAQTVTARTYTLYKMLSRSVNHPDADICTDFACCCAYLEEEEMSAKWGEDTASYIDKIKTAVRETDGLAIEYNNEPILAAFHSSSYLKTRSSSDVWSRELPYLIGVASPETEADVPNYYGVTEISVSEFKSKLLAKYPKANLTGKPETWFKNEKRDIGVISIDIGGITVPGTEVRSMFGLRSTTFSITASSDKITFHTTGYGHGVGMSQYGAEVLAKNGLDFKQIINWYFKGVSIVPYRQNVSGYIPVK